MTTPRMIPLRHRLLSPKYSPLERLYTQIARRTVEYPIRRKCLRFVLEGLYGVPRTWAFPLARAGKHPFRATRAWSDAPHPGLIEVTNVQFANVRALIGPVDLYAFRGAERLDLPSVTRKNGVLVECAYNGGVPEAVGDEPAFRVEFHLEGVEHYAAKTQYGQRMQMRRLFGVGQRL